MKIEGTRFQIQNSKSFENKSVNIISIHYAVTDSYEKVFHFKFPFFGV